MKRFWMFMAMFAFLVTSSNLWACEAHEKAESQPVKAGQKTQGK
jgi:hypothetical protein